MRSEDRITLHKLDRCNMANKHKNITKQGKVLKADIYSAYSYKFRFFPVQRFSPIDISCSIFSPVFSVSNSSTFPAVLNSSCKHAPVLGGLCLICSSLRVAVPGTFHHNSARTFAPFLDICPLVNVGVTVSVWGWASSSSSLYGTKVCRYNWHNAGSLDWPFPMRKM